MEGTDALTAVAEVSLGLAGFTGIVMALRSRADSGGAVVAARLSSRLDADPSQLGYGLVHFHRRFYQRSFASSEPLARTARAVLRRSPVASGVRLRAVRRDPVPQATRLIAAVNQTGRPRGTSWPDQRS